ncbi:MAG: flavodoxin family protein [Thermoproteota archaeon]
MRILGVSGSNRMDGNSYLLLKEMFRDTSCVETRIVQLAELSIKPCELCFDQCAREPFGCVLEDDFKRLFREMESADAVVIACPFYFYVPSKFQAFVERMSCLDYFTEERHGKGLSPLKGKWCALIAVSASGSSFNAFQILHHLQEFVLMLGARLVTVDSWPFIGLSVKTGSVKKGTVLKEEDSIKHVKELMKLLIERLEHDSEKRVV